MDAPPWVYIFNPTDIGLCAELDFWAEQFPTATQPSPLPLAVPTHHQPGHDALWNSLPFEHEMLDGELAYWIKQTRDRLREPYGENLLFIASETLADLEAEARRRVLSQKRPPRETWRDADLLAEVEAVCGPGQRKNRHWWFRCPFHEDRTPSLEVNAEARVWHAFCCNRSGGVVAWRKEIRGTRGAG